MARLTSAVDDYFAVSEMLGELPFSPRMPARTRSRLHGAVYQLRKAAAPAAHIAVRESMAVALHRLKWAVFHRDKSEEAEARGDSGVR